MVTYPFIEPTPLDSSQEMPVDRPFPERLMKRIFDIIIAGFVTLAVLIWLIPILGILVKLSSPGPILFVQRRTGRHGTQFQCLKLRTMVHREPEKEYLQATRDDKRVTRLGSFLRKSNLDEMPQFLNVLMGHMSIVGPRPHPIQLDEKHWYTTPGYRERYRIKPGITGLAQVRGARGETREQRQMRNRVRYDHWYIRRQSLFLDAKICWWTIKSTIKGDTSAF